MTVSSERQDPQSTGARIAMISPETLSAVQREIYDKIVSGPRGRVVGPLRVVLHSPELADRWQLLGEYLRYRTQLPPVISELTVITVGRYWNSQPEWSIHAPIARECGVPAEIIEAIRTARPPVFRDATSFAVYEYIRELLQFGNVSDAAYARILELIGKVALVELTALIGYYTMVALTLNVHEVPLPGNADSLLELPQDGSLLRPTPLPTAQWSEPADTGTN
jgi:4-carboxymuconolactone decarboxylase